MSPRAASWLAWSLAGLALAVFVADVALYILARSARVPISLGTGGTVGDMLVFVPFLAFPIVGALIASRRPENPIGWICLADGLLWMLFDLIDHYSALGLARPGSVPFPVALAALNRWLWVPAVGLLGTYLILLFPDGKLPSRRWRPLAWLSGAVIVLLSIAEGLAPGPLQGLGGVRNPFGLEGQPWVADAVGVVVPLLPLCILASALSLVLRFRRSGGEVRQQINWIAFAASFVGLAYLAIMSAGMVGSLMFGLETSGTGGTLPFWLDLLEYVAVLSFAGVPVAVGFAVLRYRLYDIDLLINRTLVYGTLTACVVGIYVLVVGYLGALFSTGGNLANSLVATGIVAVLFAPLRDRLQRGVNRLMYGERDDPYSVLSRLGQRLEATLEPHAVLPAVAETVAHALKLPHVAIELKRGEEYEAVAEYGRPAGEPLRLPLVYGTETVGRIVLSPRNPGESFGPADHRLLEDLARQAGVAAHAVRLTDDLQRSRERLITAREEERRRLRRNLHDGLGPALSSAMLKLGATRRMLPSGSPAEDLIAEVRDDLRATVADVRGLVYDLRPPALDQLGLVPAIRDYAEQCASEDEDGMRITVDAPEELPPLPAAVEVAAYYIAREAITNTARHARARSCRVHLTLQDGPERVELRLEITDDGVGLPAERHAGVGLSSMRERAEELGGKFSVKSSPEGGTRVVARLPVGKE
jgi:signal transduction histidine kinase